VLLVLQEGAQTRHGGFLHAVGREAQQQHGGVVAPCYERHGLPGGGGAGEVARQLVQCGDGDTATRIARAATATGVALRRRASALALGHAARTAGHAPEACSACVCPLLIRELRRMAPVSPQRGASDKCRSHANATKDHTTFASSQHAASRRFVLGAVTAV
jgi:hypothetical protein